MASKVRVIKTALRLTRGDDATVLDRFETFVGTLNQMYGLDLHCPRLDPKGLKQFCSSLIEGQEHPWSQKLRRASIRTRYSVAHSLFLFRKVIPSEKPDVDAYAGKLAQAQEPPDEEFASYALHLVRRLFPYGWDRTYQDRCLTSTLPTTSCSEVGRAGGGCRGLERAKREEFSEFLNYVLSAAVPARRGVSRVQAVLTGGKWRTISIPPRVDNRLRPLHKALYDRLSRFDWLLRGKEKPERFKDFTPQEGEVFVSGDYENATDNLNSDLQQLILSELLERSWTIPSGVRRHALDIYRSNLAVTNGGVCLSGARFYQQRRGQLMGQLTSFPLLCLINYITFRYSIRRPVPVRINGDDIVFRATPDEVTRWERNVMKGGLTLSKGKTLIHRRVFTLNSSLFIGTRSGGRNLGFLRPKTLFPTEEIGQSVASLNGRFYSATVGLGWQRRRFVRTVFLALNSRVIHASRRSVTRVLGLSVDEGMLRDVGLWHRELFYLEQIVEPALPRMEKGGVPKGWRPLPESLFTREQVALLKKEWSAECVDHAWHSDFSLADEVGIEDIQRGALAWGLKKYLPESRVRKWLRMTNRQYYRWVYLRERDGVFGRVRPSRARTVWWSSRVLAKPARLTIGFVDARGVVWEGSGARIEPPLLEDREGQGKRPDLRPVLPGIAVGVVATGSHLGDDASCKGAERSFESGYREDECSSVPTFPRRCLFAPPPHLYTGVLPLGAHPEGRYKTLWVEDDSSTVCRLQHT